MKLVELFKLVTGRPMVSKQKTRREWEEFAEEIYEKVGEALDYWCWEISGDPVIVCYESHADRDLYELAEEFVGWSTFGITEEDLELLREMPDDIYEKYSEKMRRAIERVIRELERKYGRPEEEY
ncbi:MAG TPA: hypothetical protein ENG66_05100 [Thermococcus sp.]|nr:MAG: hypothetical protein DRP04_06310 [Archaeoglobales archaeon]HDH44750.1 hypothetical protein [Thermococcus sp.]